MIVFAGAVIGYAVYSVNKSNASEITAVDQIDGVETFDYAAGQQHVASPVDYQENPPVGGPHDGEWADCTGSVYSLEIRHENAVHALEHGAVWITYDPSLVDEDDVATLSALVDGNSGLMLTPYAGLASESDLMTPISLQSWNHRLGVTSVDDPRIEQYIDFFVFGQDADGEVLYPEPGASCEQPRFLADPLPVGADSRTGEGGVQTDAPSTRSDSTSG